MSAVPTQKRGTPVKPREPTLAELDASIPDAAPRAAAPAPDPFVPVAAPGRFKIYNYAESQTRPRLAYIVDEVIPEGELMVVFGDSGCGKTFLVYDVLASISRGIPWMGREIKTQGPTLIVHGEGAKGAPERARAYVASHPGVCTTELPRAIYEAPNITDPTDANALLKVCYDSGPWTAICLDSLSSVTPGANENSGEDMSVVTQFARRLHKATGALVIYIAHSGVKDKGRMRGHTSLRAAADTQIMVADGRWSINKQREGADGISGGFSLQGVRWNDDKFEEVSSCFVVPGVVPVTLSKTDNKMMAILKSVGGKGSLTELADIRQKQNPGQRPDNNIRDTKRALEELIVKREVTVTDDGVYSLKGGFDG